MMESNHVTMDIGTFERSDDDMLNEYDRYLGKYLHMIYYSKNLVNPEEYIRKYTLQYNELLRINCPKHFAPFIFANKIRIPKTWDICPVTQATSDFWKIFKKYKTNVN